MQKTIYEFKDDINRLEELININFNLIISNNIVPKGLEWRRAANLRTCYNDIKNDTNTLVAYKYKLLDIEVGGIAPARKSYIITKYKLQLYTNWLYNLKKIKTLSKQAKEENKESEIFNFFIIRDEIKIVEEEINNLTKIIDQFVLNNTIDI
jgi:hypothetical protein